MLLHSLRERAEDNAGLRELFLEGRGDRDAVENGVNGHAGQPGALVQRDTELVIGFQQLRIDFVEALGAVFIRFGRRVVRDFLEVDGRVVHMRPFRLLHIEPLAIGAQPPFEHELGFILARRYGANDVLVEAGRQALGFDIGDETVLVSPVDELFEIFLFCCHGQLLFSTRTGRPAKLNVGTGVLVRVRSIRLTSSSARRIATLMFCQALPTLQTSS